jgi:hypothetical protein
MQYDEALLKHRVLLADARRIELDAEWERLQGMGRLQRSLRLVRARLGVAPAQAE